MMSNHIRTKIEEERRGDDCVDDLEKEDKKKIGLLIQQMSQGMCFTADLSSAVLP